MDRDTTYYSVTAYFVNVIGLYNLYSTFTTLSANANLF